jgi:hypothetical protein
VNAATHGSPLGRPYCSACNHDLTGAIDSARCPECGKPLVETLAREGANGLRKPMRRYQSSTRLFGLPLVSIALGPDARGRAGRARGYIAIGDHATGVFALGGFARGVVALGGVSLGGVTFGGVSLGTFAAFGGLSVAWLGSAVGGFALGLVANGGFAAGAIAQGGFAAGWLARGAAARGVHVIQFGGRGSAAMPGDAETKALFDQFSWLVGPSTGGPMIHYGLAWTLAIAILVAALAALPILLARTRRDRIEEELSRTPAVADRARSAQASAETMRDERLR